MASVRFVEGAGGIDKAVAGGCLAGGVGVCGLALRLRTQMWLRHVYFRGMLLLCAGALNL